MALVPAEPVPDAGNVGIVRRELEEPVVRLLGLLRGLWVISESIAEHIVGGGVVRLQSDDLTELC